MRIEVENDRIRERKKQEYQDLVDEMDQKGFEANLEKISIKTANLFGIVLFILVSAITYPIYYLVNGKIDPALIFGFEGTKGMLIFFGAYLLSIFVHEFIHGFLWQFTCEKKWGSIDFGFNPKTCTPYCHCREALSFGRYFIGSIGPTLFLGIIPIILGIIFKSLFLVSFGVLGFVGGAGDLMVIFSLRKHRDSRLFDHPYEVGYAYFTAKKGD